MANAIINNASFASSQNADEITPMTVFSNSNLAVGDIVSFKPTIFSTGNLRRLTDWNVVGEFGNTFVIWNGNENDYAFQSVYYDGTTGRSLTYSFKSMIGYSTYYAGIHCVAKYDDNHFIVFTSTYEDDEYTKLQLTIIEVSTDGTLSRKSQFLVSDLETSNSSPNIFSTIYPIAGGIGAYSLNARTITAFAIDSNYQITKLKSLSNVNFPQINYGSTTIPINTVSIPARKKIFSFTAVSVLIITVPSSASENFSQTTVNFTTLPFEMRYAETYVLDDKIYIQGRDTDDSTGRVNNFYIYKFIPSANTMVDFHKLQNTAYCYHYLNSNFSHLNSDLQYRIFTYDETAPTSSNYYYWACLTIVDIQNNCFIAPVTPWVVDMYQGNKPAYLDLFCDRYDVFMDKNDVSFFDARYVEKFNMDGVPAGKISAILGNGKYEMRPLR